MSLKTKSKGKALIVTQVKPVAYLSTSYLRPNLIPFLESISSIHAGMIGFR